MCGVDEAGRGPLAGPVVAAAVILDPERIPDGIDDSKVLDADTREVLYARITATRDRRRRHRRRRAHRPREHPLRHHVGDGRSGGEARRSCRKLAAIDGNRAPKLGCASRTHRQGRRASCLSIAAASIIAKVTRDRMMIALAREHPGYGFERHKGYGTPEHHDAIRRLGVTPHHRRSFRAVQLALGLVLEDSTTD